MRFLDRVSLPPTRDGDVIRLYLASKHARNFSGARALFTEDAVLSGPLHLVSGRDAVITAFQDFCDHMLTFTRIEAIKQAVLTDQWIILYWLIVDTRTEVSIVDLITLRDGRIARVENCFDADKMPEPIKLQARYISGM